MWKESIAWHTISTEALVARKEEKQQSEPNGAAQFHVDTPELIAAISFMTDLTPAGSTYHTWRVSLVAHRLASIIAPDIARAVFHAGLMQNIGAVGADKHVTEYVSVLDQAENEYIRSHPERGAALIGMLPDMTVVAQFVRFHHEWWNGRGYPRLRAGKDIPLGAQILRIADEAVARGCFSTYFDLGERLRSLAQLTGKAWSESLWATFVRSTSDAEFYNALIDPGRVAELVADGLNEVPLPADLCTETSVERILHVFSALTDAAIPEKEGHTIRTARFAKAIAEQMKLSEEDVRTVYRAGLVHDCGWVSVPPTVAKRPGKYSEQEMELARGHATATERILGCLPDRPGMAELGKIASRHHEWLDGSGYPRGLTANELHQFTRILSVADAFDAMVSISNYRVISVKCALMRLSENAGTQFDTDAVAALSAVIECGQLPADMKLAA